MFETTFSSAAAAPPSGGALRALDWAELTARFSAVRDLRALAAGMAGAAHGSFAAHAADALHDGERDVNHTALGGCSTRLANNAATPPGGSNGDRGTQ